jgi:hypothetical protein
MTDPDVCKDFKDGKIPFKYDLLENEPDASCLFLIRNRFKELKINNFNSLMRFCCEDEERFIRIFNAIETDQYNVRQFSTCRKLHAIITGVNKDLIKQHGTLEKILSISINLAPDEINKLTDALNVDNFVYLEELVSEEIISGKDSEPLGLLEPSKAIEQDKIPKQIEQAKSPKWPSLTQRGGAGNSDAMKELRALLIETMRRYKPFIPFNLAQIEGDILKRIKRINKFLKFVSLNRPNAMIKNTKCTVLAFMIHKCNDEKTGRICPECPEIQPDTECENCVDRIKKTTSDVLQQLSGCIGLSAKDIVKQLKQLKNTGFSKSSVVIEQAGGSKCNLSKLKSCIESMSNKLSKEQSLEVITQMSILITAKLISEYAENAYSTCANVDEDAMRAETEAVRKQAADELAKAKKEAENAAEELANAKAALVKANKDLKDANNKASFADSEAKQSLEKAKAAQLAAETAAEASRKLAEASRNNANEAELARKLAEEAAIKANDAKINAEEEANRKANEAELARERAEEAQAAKNLAESNLAVAQEAVKTCSADLKKCEETAANALEKLKECNQNAANADKALAAALEVTAKANTEITALKLDLSKCRKDLEHEKALHDASQFATNEIKQKLTEANAKITDLEKQLADARNDINELQEKERKVMTNYNEDQIAKILSIIIDPTYEFVKKTVQKGGEVKSLKQSAKVIATALQTGNINVDVRKPAENDATFKHLAELSNYAFENRRYINRDPSLSENTESLPNMAPTPQVMNDILNSQALKHIKDINNDKQKLPIKKKANITIYNDVLRDQYPDQKKIALKKK